LKKLQYLVGNSDKSDKKEDKVDKKRTKKGEKKDKIATKSTKISLVPYQQDIIVVVLIFLAVFILFNPFILQNKVFSRGDDTVAALSWEKFVKNNQVDGRVPYWCPDVFAGFPSYSAGGYMDYPWAPNYKSTRWINPIFYVSKILELLYIGHQHVSWLIVLMCLVGWFTYWLLREVGISRWVAMVLGLIMAWNPYYISLITASHGGKLHTLIFLPLVLLLTHRVMEKRKLIDIGLLGMAVGWVFTQGGHAQVIYYAGLLVVLYFLYRTVMEWKEGWEKVAANAGSLVVAGVIGLMMGALWTVPLYSYIPYSIRGMSPAFAEASVQGLSIDWATGWSFHPMEILTFIVPSFFGLQSNYFYHGQHVPMYWGWMPFTSSSFYLGIVPVFFTVIALIYSRNRIVWFCVVLSIIVFFMSLGEHFLPLYKLLYAVLPGFSKFRTPSLILTVMQIALIIMAGFGIQAVLSGKVICKTSKTSLDKIFLILAAVSGGLLLLVLVLKSALFSGLSSFMFIKAGDQSHYNAQTLLRLQQLRFDAFHRDLMLALFFIGLLFVFISYKLKGTLSNTTFLVLIAVVAVVDMWIISHRFFEPQPKSVYEEPFYPTPAMNFVKKDNSIFRVLPLGEGFQDNLWMTQGIQSVGGYQGAKVRRFQDILDYVLYKGPDPNFPLNHNMVDLFNAKYLIAKGRLPGDRYRTVFADQASGMVVSENPQVMPRAFLVDSVRVIQERRDVLEAMNDPNWNPRTMAIVEQEIPYESGVGEGSVEVESYGVEEVKLSVEVPRPSFLVLLDTHYPGNWFAEIDGQKADIYLTDYLFRGVVVPAGKHEIRFYFHCKAIQAGTTLSTIGYIVALLVLLAGLGWEWRKKKLAN
jgi:hypothetical protein